MTRDLRNLLSVFPCSLLSFERDIGRRINAASSHEVLSSTDERKFATTAPVSPPSGFSVDRVIRAQTAFSRLLSHQTTDPRCFRSLRHLSKPCVRQARKREAIRSEGIIPQTDQITKANVGGFGAGRRKLDGAEAWKPQSL